MRNRFSFTLTTAPIILFIAIITGSLTFSCTGGNMGPPAKNLIPEKDLVQILTQLSLTDGLLTVPQVRDKFILKDTLGTYVDVIESHGYSKEDMDNTMNFYYLKKQKKLIRMYDQVLANLSELELTISSRPDKTLSIESDLWNGSRFYHLPDISGNDNTEFSIFFKPPGTYTLSYNLTLYPADQSVNPGFSGWLCHADSIETGKRRYLEPVRYFRDGVTRTYLFTGEIKGREPMVICGKLFERENNPETGEPSVSIDNISLFLNRHAL